MSKVLVIGGGAAGMMAAYAAAKNQHKVHIIEKNEKLGKKLFITGKGRCNVTNACEMEELLASVVSNAKFLYHAFYGFTNEQTMEFFEQIGVPLKIERGKRVFPVSDHASDIIKGMERELKRLGVRISLHTCVKEIKVKEKCGDAELTKKQLTEKRKVTGVVLQDGRMIYADAVIVACGGISYPSTGSTGDGYRFAESVGHRMIPCIPSLVPMEIKEEYPKELQGLSLRNITGTIYDGKKKLYEDFGELLFTHFGVSGPIIISASSYVGKKLKEKELSLVIDLKPALSAEQLEQRLLREFGEKKNKQFKNAIDALFPAKLVPVMVRLSGISPEKRVNEISKEERKQFVNLIKGFKMTLTGLRSFKEAIITQGGVCTKEIDPATMESKKVKGLYFVGEVLDLDALTGGFNLQIAWSTGYAAGSAV